MITAVDHVHVVAKDMDASIRFYTGGLGFTLLRRLQFGPGDARRELAYVELGGFMLELVEPSHDGDLVGNEARPFALTVERLDETLAELSKKGIESTSQWPGFSFKGRTAVINDPSGIAIELREWAPDDGPRNPNWRPERADVVRTA